MKQVIGKRVAKSPGTYRIVVGLGAVVIGVMVGVLIHDILNDMNFMGMVFTAVALSVLALVLIALGVYGIVKFRLFPTDLVILDGTLLQFAKPPLTIDLSQIKHIEACHAGSAGAGNTIAITRHSGNRHTQRFVDDVEQVVDTILIAAKNNGITIAFNSIIEQMDDFMVFIKGPYLIFKQLGQKVELKDIRRVDVNYDRCEKTGDKSTDGELVVTDSFGNTFTQNDLGSIDDFVQLIKADAEVVGNYSIEFSSW